MWRLQKRTSSGCAESTTCLFHVINQSANSVLFIWEDRHLVALYISAATVAAHKHTLHSLFHIHTHTHNDWTCYTLCIVRAMKVAAIKESFLSFYTLPSKTIWRAGRREKTQQWELFCNYFAPDWQASKSAWWRDSWAPNNAPALFAAPQPTLWSLFLRKNLCEDENLINAATAGKWRNSHLTIQRTQTHTFITFWRALRVFNSQTDKIHLARKIMSMIT